MVHSDSDALFYLTYVTYIKLIKKKYNSRKIYFNRLNFSDAPEGKYKSFTVPSIHKPKSI